MLEEKEVDFEGRAQPYQKLELVGLTGEKKGQKIVVENGDMPLANVVKYKKYDKVVIIKNEDFGGRPVYLIGDSVRRDGLLLLLVIFVVGALAVTKWRGLGAIVSMVFSFLVIFKLVLPQILGGADPVGVAIIASALIIPVTFYLSHGFSKKTTVAIAGTFLALVFTGLLAKLFIQLTYLHGFSSEEASFLSIDQSGVINMSGLLLAGIVIGALGVLDDVTVSQAAVVEQLLTVAPKKPRVWEIFSKAMVVGRDHIASMVNTLILVYAGASLPLLLIFINNPHPFAEIINYEFVAEEIVRTLVGSIGLIVAVPITTLIACWVVGGKNEKR